MLWYTQIPGARLVLERPCYRDTLLVGFGLAVLVSIPVSIAAAGRQSSTTRQGSRLGD